VKALVTGAAAGIGRALVERLERDGAEVLALDLRDGFDVADPGAWERVGAVDLACLNAGIGTGVQDVAELELDAYRRIMATNVDGVVLGVRRLARVMAPGGSIVATASLAGLVGMEGDPVYTLTKHAVVGFVRAAAPSLAARGLRLNAVCPGFTDTALLDGVRSPLLEAGLPLLRPQEVANAILAAARSEGTGEAWVVQPGREPVVFRFPNVPGPRR
jgi:NAD(P)-dependent dehydrogenase (short-subunit alcohol dehydrogenase family)